MTRVNAGINPRELHRAHLVAELREITMVPASLLRSLRTRTSKSILKEIPRSFTLNTGHVKFFYNKMTFLSNRFHLLADEMERRGYIPDRTRGIAFSDFDPIWDNNWTPTEKDNDVVRERIALRISEKPHLYQDELD